MDRTLYILSSGTLRRKDGALLMEAKDVPPIHVPVEAVEEILVFGEVSMNKRLLELLTQHGIVLHFFDYHGSYAGTYWPRGAEGGGPVLLAQAEHWLDEAKRHVLATSFIAGAIANMRCVALRYRRRGVEVSDILEGLDRYAEQLPRTEDGPSLMGIEGSARRCYYQLFDRVAQGRIFKLGKRARRPPTSPMNCLISFLNSVCYAMVLARISRTHLDPRIGFLHDPSDRRLSLHLDLAEVFKPLLVDRLIFSLVNKGRLHAKDFERREGGATFLTEDARRMVLTAWDDRLNGTIGYASARRPTGKTAHPAPPSALGHPARRASWRHLVLMEARKVQRHVLGGTPYEPFVYDRDMEDDGDVRADDL